MESSTLLSCLQSDIREMALKVFQSVSLQKKMYYYKSCTKDIHYLYLPFVKLWCSSNSTIDIVKCKQIITHNDATTT